MKRRGEGGGGGGGGLREGIGPQVHIKILLNLDNIVKSNWLYMYMYVNKNHQYRNYSTASFPQYNSLTVVLTVIGILVNSTPQ